MKIDIISSNMAGKKITENLSLPTALKENQKDTDIYVECTQENITLPYKEPFNWQQFTRNAQAPENYLGSKLAEDNPDVALVSATELKEKQFLIQSVLNDNSLFKSTKFNIMITIYIKNELKAKMTDAPIIGRKFLQEKDGMFGSALLGASKLVGLITKGAVWVKLFFPRYSVLFVNMHLPILKSSQNLGFNFRKQALFSVLKEINPLMDTKTYLVVCGDLNFRYSLIDGHWQEQLDYLLKKQDSQPFPVKLKDLPYPSNKKPTFTCKFKDDTSSQNSCRLKAIPSNTENFNNFNKTLKKKNNSKVFNNLKCANVKRMPSQCDRFLIGEKSGIKVLDHGAVSNFFTKSDHNSIYTRLEIDDLPGERTMANLEIQEESMPVETLAPLIIPRRKNTLNNLRRQLTFARSSSNRGRISREIAKYTGETRRVPKAKILAPNNNSPIEPELNLFRRK